MERVRLDDVCIRASSSYAQKDLENLEGKYPVYGASGLIKFINSYHQEKEYIAVVKDGAGIGRTMYLPAQSSIIGTLQYLIPKDNILSKYLYYAVKYMHLEKYYTGATIPHIYYKSYQREELNLPNKSTQVQIVEILGNRERAIEAKQKQLAELDSLVKARFVEMFGDCRTNPKGWETRNLEDISVVGSSKRVFVEDLKEDGIPFYRGTEVGALAEGKIISAELFITKEHYKELCQATGTPQVGELLMPSICPDGRIWLVNSEEPFYFKDGRVLWVHDISDDYDVNFLLYTLKDRIMTDYLSIASGTTFAELKIFALKRCQVFAVPIELQREFAAFIKQVDKSKVAYEKINYRLLHLCVI